MYRTEKRSGLIRARLLGAKHVKGQVITFLDAHCECTEGWLEPLLSRIANDRHTVVCPIIDVISDDTFEYIPASDMTWGGFNWKLNFRWYFFHNIIITILSVAYINFDSIIFLFYSLLPFERCKRNLSCKYGNLHILHAMNRLI